MAQVAGDRASTIVFPLPMDLLGKLLGYKSGQLKGTIMHQHAKGYSDEELSRIADHFSALK